VGNLKKSAPKIVTAAMAMYFIFFMNLGTRTFAQHVIRISNTPESRELAYEMMSTAREATEAVTRRARGAVSGSGSSSTSSSTSYGYESNYPSSSYPSRY
jgi:hypothetical protein